MTAQLQAQPENLLNEGFEDFLHPADLCQLIEAAIEKYNTLPTHRVERKQYRTRLNALIDRLTEIRGFRQFNYVH
jgi:hypothetical protein